VSFGGAIVVAAAADRRVGATVSIVGIDDAGRWLQGLESRQQRAKYPEGYPVENVALAASFRPGVGRRPDRPRAVLFIARADDSVVSASESVGMYERAGESKALKVFPEDNHGGPLGPLLAETADVTNGFLDRHLKGRP
jgi:hypothetical protein